MTKLGNLHFSFFLLKQVLFSVFLLFTSFYQCGNVSGLVLFLSFINPHNTEHFQRFKVNPPPLRTTPNGKILF